MPLPVTDMAVSSQFGWRVLRGEWNWHEGTDFPVAFGTPVMSVAPGTVVQTGVNPSYGEYVIIEHIMQCYSEGGVLEWEETFYSFYAHLSRGYVFEGQSIQKGQQIALSGGDPNRHFAGNSTGAHLHLELRRAVEYGTQFDPYDYLLRPLSETEEEEKTRIRFKVNDGE